MDVRVDDGFGGLEELISKGKAIDTQINTGFQKETKQQSDHDAQLYEQENTMQGSLARSMRSLQKRRILHS